VFHHLSSSQEGGENREKEMIETQNQTSLQSHTLLRKFGSMEGACEDSEVRAAARNMTGWAVMVP